MQRNGKESRGEGSHLGSGCDTKGVVAPTHHLGHVHALQGNDSAGLHPVLLRTVSLPALPLRVSPPADDIVHRDGYGVLCPVTCYKCMLLA